MKILIEQFGPYYRLTLPCDASVQDKTTFANLYWLIHGGSDNGDIETFTAAPGSLKRALKSIRIAKTANWFHATKWPAKARQRGKWLLSGIGFQRVEQRASQSLCLAPHSIGNADYQEAGETWQTGFRSKAEELFDKVA